MNATVTQYTSSVKGVSLPTDQPHGLQYSKVSSDWMSSYIKATRPILEILKMAGYFPDRPRICTFFRKFKAAHPFTV